jgi:hypothetical protein
MDTLETVALDQVEVMDRLVKMNRDLISELSQYRRMDAEEKELEDLVKRMGRL